MTPEAHPPSQHSAAPRRSPRLVVDATQKQGALQLRELWQYRELLFFLTWRQVMVRYKQTAVGIAWVVVQPLATMAIMTLVFNVFLEIESGDTPYPIFVLSGLIFWRYFSSAIGEGGQSLVNNSKIISKVYFPRLIVPLSSCLTPVVDFTIALLVLVSLMPFFGMLPSIRIVLLPFLLLLTFLTALSVSLWLSALNVRYRDVRQAIPFLIQIWMYLVPIMYPIDRVPEAVRPFYSINPMVGVVQGARWAILGEGAAPDLASLFIGLVTVLLLLLGGLRFFYRVERSFADVI